MSVTTARATAKNLLMTGRQSIRRAKKDLEIDDPRCPAEILWLFGELENMVAGIELIVEEL